MKKTLLALATAAVLAVATLAPTTADARCRGCGVGLGVLRGLAAGAVIGRADARLGAAHAGQSRGAGSPAQAPPSLIRRPIIRLPATSRMPTAQLRPMAAPAVTGR